MPLDSNEKAFLRKIYVELRILQETVKFIDESNADLVVPTPEDINGFREYAVHEIDRLQPFIRE